MVQTQEQDDINTILFWDYSNTGYGPVTLVVITGTLSMYSRHCSCSGEDFCPFKLQQLLQNLKWILVDDAW